MSVCVHVWVRARMVRNRDDGMLLLLWHTDTCVHTLYVHTLYIICYTMTMSPCNFLAAQNFFKILVPAQRELTEVQEFYIKVGCCKTR